jgi:hypothetical protein
MSNPRAVRYRRLALAEPNRENADLLYKLADEAEKGILVTSDWKSAKSPLKKGDEVIIV